MNTDFKMHVGQADRKDGKPGKYRWKIVDASSKVQAMVPVSLSFDTADAAEEHGKQFMPNERYEARAAADKAALALSKSQTLNEVLDRKLKEAEESAQSARRDLAKVKQRAVWGWVVAVVAVVVCLLFGG